MFSSFLKYKEFFSGYIDPRSSTINKENLVNLLPKLGMQFQENVLEGAELKENLYEYETAFKLALINYGQKLNNTLITKLS